MDAVGFGTDAATGLEYMLLRNSWDVTWGDGGYGRITMGDPSYGGTCLIFTDNHYPVIA